MALPLDSTTLAVLAAIAFAPAILLLFWVRSRETSDREPLRAVLGLFLYGATLGVGVAILVSLLVDGAVAGDSVLLAAVVIAPLVEEPSKALGFLLVRRHVDELEDGIVYGIAVGLGFAATESLLYGLVELQDSSVGGALAVVSARNVSSLLLHAGTSALVGFAYASARVRGAGRGLLLGAFALAILLHAFYNALVLAADWLGFLAAIVMVVALMAVLVRKVRDLDALPPPA